MAGDQDESRGWLLIKAAMREHVPDRLAKAEKEWADYQSKLESTREARSLETAARAKWLKGERDAERFDAGGRPIDDSDERIRRRMRRSRTDDRYDIRHWRRAFERAWGEAECAFRSLFIDWHLVAVLCRVGQLKDERADHFDWDHARFKWGSGIIADPSAPKVKYRFVGVVPGNDNGALPTASAKPRSVEDLSIKRGNIHRAMEALGNKLDGLTVKQEAAEINKWLKENGLPTVDERTIRRYKKWRKENWRPQADVPAAR